MDAIISIHNFAIRGDKLDANFPLHMRTRWLGQLDQTFEIEAELEGHLYIYRLELSGGVSGSTLVQSETVHCDNNPIFEFHKGEVHLYDDSFTKTVTYPFDSKRSAFETISELDDNQLLTRFKSWLTGLSCFRINPYQIGFNAKEAIDTPEYDLSNFASWFAYLSITGRASIFKIESSLQSSMAGFSHLQFRNFMDNGNFTGTIMGVCFEQEGRKPISFDLNEISEGQKCLVCLYTILHCVVEKGHSVIIDEPDNFVSLREIQPWLTALSDAIENGNGQVLLISHHPELIDQWAPENGVRFVRDGVGPARVKKFVGDPESSLSPSELIARGWDE